MTTLYSDLPYVHAGGDGGVRSTTQMVVIHATDNTASAQAEANYARTRPDQTSAHFYVDDGQVIQALPTDHVAYGCFSTGNGRSIQFELSGLSGHISDATMRRAAPVVARVCRDWGIPVRKVGPAELVAGARGVCGHADVTAAWHQGDHIDPGPGFDWARFISYVGAGDAMLKDDPDGLWLYPRVEAIAQLRPPVEGPEKGQDLPILQALREIRQNAAKAAAGVQVTLSAEQLDTLAQKVATLLAPVLASPAAVAGAVVDEQARRLGNG